MPDALQKVTTVQSQPEAALIIGTATIGSYTTFSTWMFETDRLAESGALRAAAVNLVKIANGATCATVRAAL